MNKKILIIGIGYIGSRLYQVLSKKHQVSSVDLEWQGNPAKIPNNKRDYREITASGIKPYDVIILTASHSSVASCVGNELASNKNNVDNFIDLFKKINDDQIFIYMSSSSVYGMINVREAVEINNCFTPSNAYDLQKFTIDNYTKIFDKPNVYGLRLATVAGYSPNLRIDTMINSMVYAAKTKGQIDLYNPEIMRPIVGTRDLAASILQIIKLNKSIGGIFNISSFNNTSNEIAHQVGKFMGVPVIKFDKPPDVVDNSKLMTRAYDFSISNLKFRTYFQFEFKDTVKSICQELLDNWNGMVFGKRTIQINYE